MKEPSIIEIQKNLDKFTPIYNEGEEINPIPENIRITVYCESSADRGLLIGVFKKDIGIEMLVAKSWIYHSELMQFTNSISEKQAAEEYQDLFNHMSQEHGLTLTIGEMDDIIAEVEKMQNA